MTYAESQRDSSQGSGEGGIAQGDRFGIDFRPFGVGRTENHYDVFRTILLSGVLDALLIFQIHGSCGRSDEALGRGEHDFGASALGTGRNGHTGDTVTVTDDDGLSALENTHFYFPPSFQIFIPCPWGGKTKE